MAVHTVAAVPEASSASRGEPGCRGAMRHLGLSWLRAESFSLAVDLWATPARNCGNGDDPGAVPVDVSPAAIGPRHRRATPPSMSAPWGALAHKTTLWPHRRPLNVRRRLPTQTAVAAAAGCLTWPTPKCWLSLAGARGEAVLAGQVSMRRQLDRCAPFAETAQIGTAAIRISLC